LRNKVCMGMWLCTVAASAATNDVEPGDKPLFALPTSKLIALEPNQGGPTTNATRFGEPLQAPSSLTQSFRATPATAEISLSSFQSDFEYSVYVRLEKLGVFDRPEPVSDSLLERSLNSVFASEVIRFRKVELSGSLITAIKRKNPLCLLNPIVFNLSW